MPIPLAVVAGKITAAMYNLLAVATNMQGSTLVVPTGVAGTGVTFASTGKITMTAATAAANVTVDGVFSSNYDRYVITLDGIASTNAAWGLQLRSSGTSDAAANYDETNSTNRNATSTSSTNVAATSWPLIPGGTLHKLIIEISYPAQAQPTVAEARAIFATNPQVSSVNNGYVTRTITHRTAAAYDGFKLLLSTGTFTGSIRVEGRNNG